MVYKLLVIHTIKGTLRDVFITKSPARDLNVLEKKFTLSKNKRLIVYRYETFKDLEHLTIYKMSFSNGHVFTLKWMRV